MAAWMRRVAEQFGLDRQVFGNPAYIWIFGLALFALLFVGFYFATALVRRRSQRLHDANGHSDWPKLLKGLADGTRTWFLLLLAAYLASQAFDFPTRGEANLRTLTKIAFLVQSAIWGSEALGFFTRRWMSARIKTDPGSVMLVSVLTFVGKAAMWTIVVLLLLENIGVQVTALITGLGIGGVAVALAAQNILGDLFASLSIAVDKPFVLGDFIIVGTEMGTVEKIGLKTTRVRALSGEQISFPNSDLLQSRIRNTTRQFDRRVVFNIVVNFTTPTEKLAALAAELANIVRRRERVRFDRAHFLAVTDAGFQFEIVYFVDSPNFNLYMDIQQAINLELVEYLRRAEIPFAAKQTMVVQPEGPSETFSAAEAASASAAATSAKPGD
jgi:small-conductance mechanosensitive channel